LTPPCGEQHVSDFIQREFLFDLKIAKKPLFLPCAMFGQDFHLTSRFFDVMPRFHHSGLILFDHNTLRQYFPSRLFDLQTNQFQILLPFLYLSSGKTLGFV
jgi:hypothetical protein